MSYIYSVYRISSTRLQNSDAYRQLQRLFIQEELTFKDFEQQKIILKMETIKSDLRMVIDLMDRTHISEMFLESNIKIMKRVEGIRNYKLLELMDKNLQHDSKKGIHNFSFYQLSDIEKLLLFKGLCFSVPPERPFELLYCGVYYSNNKDESLLQLKNKIKDFGLSSYRIYIKKDHRYENVSQEEYVAFINLINNKNIIIQKADKGNTVVIVD